MVLSPFESFKAAKKVPRGPKNRGKDPAKLRGKTPRKMFDSNRYYEVDRLGPIFLAWNMVVVKNEKGKIKEQKYKIKDEKVRSNLNLLNIF